MRKATFLIGFSSGYVLGAKAGRQRYEQIMRQARTIMRKPAVQDATATVKDQAGSALGTAKKAVTDKVTHRDGKSADAPGTAYATMSGSTGRVDPYPS